MSEQHAVSTALPELTIDVTPVLVVGGALASRDFEDVHHDAAAAVSKGLPGVICNIHTSNALLSNYVLGAVGPGLWPTRQSVQLVTPCTPGDTLHFTGEIIERTDDTLVVEARGRTARGVHVAGTVELHRKDRG